MSSEASNALQRDLYILEDETNPYGSKAETIWPSTILDQVFDNTSPTNKTLRTIISELRQEIISGGAGNIVFPVTTVNGMAGDIVLTKNHIGLDKVDNTRDIDKPLSGPQRDAVLDILRSYDFNVDLSDLYQHLLNFDNPHGVTFEQINRNGSARSYILTLIANHNSSSADTVHRDIRQSISNLSDRLNRTSIDVEERIAAALSVIDTHYRDNIAHSELFNGKEDKSNKVLSFDEVNHVLYPTTRAVVEYVAEKMAELRGEVTNVEHWIDDIVVVNSRDDLPQANLRSYRKAYFIRNGIGNNDEIAICRINPDGRTYSWDFSTFSTYSKFNMNHFIETDEGLSMNTRTIAEILMSEDTIADRLKSTLLTVLPDVMSDYYTKSDIDAMHMVSSINIMSGTQDGTIRFYINGDMNTMSEDIKVAGIKKLAFLEKVTENEIEENAVQSQHIGNKVIKSRHIDDKAVSASNMRARYGTILGNLHDSTGDTVREIPLEYLAELLEPLFSLTIDGSDLIAIKPEVIEEMVREAFLKIHDPSEDDASSMITLRNGELIVEYDDSYPEPDVSFNSEGELILNSDGSPVDEELSKYHFDITPAGFLTLTVSE